MSNADRSIWQFPKNVANKVPGWRADGKGLENKDWADPASKQDHSSNLDAWSALATSAKQDASANLTTLAGITPGAAGQAILADALVADVRDYLDVPAYVADRTALKALDETKDTRAILGETGRAGIFKAVLTSSLTAAEQAGATADTAEGIYITSGSYTWVREEFTGENFHVAWFHDHSTADLVTAFAGCVAVMQALETRASSSVNTFAARVIRFPSGDWTLSGSTVINQGGVHLTSDGDCSLLCTGTNAAIIFRATGYLDGDFLANIKVTDMRFVRSSAVDGTDIYLRFSVCKQVVVTRNRFENGTVHIQFDAAYEPVWIYANTFWHQDTAKTNAYSIRIKVLAANVGAAGAIVDADDSTSYLYSSQVWIWGNEMKAEVGDVQTHIEVEDIDGLQLFHNHIFNGEDQVVFQPVVRGTGRITNVKIENNMFDGGSDTAHNLRLKTMTGTRSLVIHMHVRSNKLNDASTYNCHIEQRIDEFHFTDNELDLCEGIHMLRLSGGGTAVCRIRGNWFRLSATASPSTSPIQILYTSLNGFRLAEIKENTFGEDESGATFPARCLLITGNSTNAGCAVVHGQNLYDSGFAAFITSTAGANVTVTALTNTSY